MLETIGLFLLTGMVIVAVTKICLTQEQSTQECPNEHFEVIVECEPKSEYEIWQQQEKSKLKLISEDLLYVQVKLITNLDSLVGAGGADWRERRKSALENLEGQVNEFKSKRKGSSSLSRTSSRI